MNFIDEMVSYEWLYQDLDYYYLYRHVPVNEYSIKNLNDGTFWFNSLEKFNDIFDCQFTKKIIPKAHEIKRIREKTTGKKVKHSVYLSRLSQDQFKIKRAYENDSYAKNFHSGTGIVCLNESPLSLLMWSHYANHHKGFMFEFKFSKKNPESYRNFLTYPIIYSDNYPVIDAYEESSDEKIKNRFLYKSKEWSYEREFRMIQMNLNHEERAKKYPSELLSSIILGLNILDDDLIKVEEALKNYMALKMGKVEIYKAEKIHNKYGITVPNHPRLDVLANSKIEKIKHQ